MLLFFLLRGGLYKRKKFSSVLLNLPQSGTAEAKGKVLSAETLNITELLKIPSFQPGVGQNTAVVCAWHAVRMFAFLAHSVYPLPPTSESCVLV